MFPDPIRQANHIEEWVSSLLQRNRLWSFKLEKIYKRNQKSQNLHQVLFSQAKFFKVFLICLVLFKETVINLLDKIQNIAKFQVSQRNQNIIPFAAAP